MLEMRAENDAVVKILEESQGITGLNVDGILDLWAKNKAELIRDILGGELIKEIPITEAFEANQEELEKAVSEIKAELTYCGECKAQTFIQNNIDGFKKNKVVDPSGYNIPIGAKLSKSFKFLTDDKAVVHGMQSILSRYIQKNKITGTLCISAHPLDFLTASDNKSNWTSCHSLQHSVRAGNISYMCDSSSLVCYIKSDTPVDIYGIEWNNKKWRMYLYFSDERNGVFAGKQYPMMLDGVLDTIRRNLLPWRFQYNAWRHEVLQGEKVKTNHYPLNDMWIPGKILIDQDPQGLNYNDLLLNTFPHGTPEYIFTYYMTEKERFKIGHSFYCLKCGKKLVQNDDCVLCPDCEVEYGFEEKEMYSYCHNCGKRIRLDGATYIMDWHGYTYCADCADEVLRYCNNCNDFYNIDEMVNDHLCKWCYEDIGEENGN